MILKIWCDPSGEAFVYREGKYVFSFHQNPKKKLPLNLKGKKLFRPTKKVPGPSYFHDFPRIKVVEFHEYNGYLERIEEG